MAGVDLPGQQLLPFAAELDVVLKHRRTARRDEPAEVRFGRERDRAPDRVV
jgi:hypothetical protein